MKRYESGVEFLSPESESKKKVEREEVVAAYKKFVEQGIKNPDDLDPNDPEVQKAHDLSDDWQEQENKSVEGNEDLIYRNNLAKTMLNIDAGFTDPKYLDEVLNDFLAQDEQETEEQENNPERVETRRQIEEAIEKVKKLLAEVE